MKVIKQSYEILDRRSLTNYEKIEQAGRIAYKSEDKIAEGSASIFIDKIIKLKHFPVLEFANVHLKLTIKSDIFDDFFLTFLIGCKFINVTSFIDDNKIFHAFVSGTVRSLIEAIQSIYTSKPSPLMSRIIKVLGDNPDIPIGISDKLEEDYKNIDVSGCDVKMLTPREILGNKMLGQREENHLMCAVKFITNRAVTHELVRHRPCSFLQESQRFCRYSQEKFGSEVTFILPSAFWNSQLSVTNPDDELNIWYDSMRFAERQYLKLLKTSSPQAARTVLPNSTKTEIIAYCTIWQWRHIFKLRVPETAEPSMREIMIPLSKEFFSEENKNKWE